MKCFATVGSAALVLAAAVMGLSSAPTQGTGRPSPEVMPSEPVFLTRRPAPGLVSRLGVDMVKRHITIDSTYKRNGAVEVSRHAFLPTAYWPTSLATFDAERIVVAGKRSNGATVVELWRLTLPSVLEVADENTSGMNYAISDASVSELTPLYDAAVSGRDTVCGMTRMLGTGGAEPAMLVRFFDSKQLVQMGLGQFFDGTADPVSTWTVRATPVPSGSATVQPELNRKDLHEWIALRHATHGYVYYLQTLSGNGPALVFTDHDRDRQFDATVLVELSDWVQTWTGDPAQILAPEY
ncbi:MAG: hypothetical protein IT454_02755 [Planctomycetes bacterium]|nr:hypothetical protein [Planctomycetota bacterium]